jgi:choline dehydrogenase-like flavoprotein
VKLHLSLTTLLQIGGLVAVFIGFASFGLMVRDRGAGRVREVAGRLAMSYALDDGDARDVDAGIRLLADVFFAAGADRVLLPTGEELTRGRGGAGGRPLLCGFHPQGTAGMGRVVDTDLRLTRRISVCDASVLPDSPGVNPQITIMALSLRLADRLAAEVA